MNEVSKYYINCEDNMFKGKKDACVPKLCEYKEVLNTRLTLDKLKQLKKRYCIKGTYNKTELMKMLYNKMRIKYSVVLIIRNYRNYKMARYEEMLEQNSFVNTEDFETLELLSKLHKHDLMGVEEEGKVYGFDILSFENLILKYKENAFNPYTRTTIKENVRQRFKDILYLKRVFKYGNRIIQVNVVEETIGTRLQDVFYRINSLGNYADSVWIEELSKEKLMKYIYELADIWEYRANLSQANKVKIYVNMNPFSDIRMSRLAYDTLAVLQNKTIKIIERLISSEEQEHASLGAFYVLGAITLVNSNAADALPWLYQSFYHAGGI